VNHNEITRAGFKILHDAIPKEWLSFTSAEAAKALGVSVRTVHRMKLKRNAARRIPYSVLMEAMAPR
jgi:hypothetical protein